MTTAETISDEDTFYARLTQMAEMTARELGAKPLRNRSDFVDTTIQHADVVYAGWHTRTHLRWRLVKGHKYLGRRKFKANITAFFVSASRDAKALARLCRGEDAEPVLLMFNPPLHAPPALLQ
jgi:hypothetical protein